MVSLYQIPILPLLVTFLHEFGHAAAALVSGGHVINLQVNIDGSGLATTSGGFQPFILCGGYLGSIFFGNLMLYTGIKHKYLSRILAAGLAILMAVISIIWFSTIASFLFTVIVGGTLLFIFIKISWSGRVFMIVTGCYSILYIIHDYNVGPSSDLESFSSIMGLTPSVWMYIWLGVALIFTGITLFFTLKRKT